MPTSLLRGKMQLHLGNFFPDRFVIQPFAMTSLIILLVSHTGNYKPCISTDVRGWFEKTGKLSSGQKTGGRDWNIVKQSQNVNFHQLVPGFISSVIKNNSIYHFSIFPCVFHYSRWLLQTWYCNSRRAVCLYARMWQVGVWWGILSTGFG